ncbi:outer membrane lipoprotein-sorting protein [Marinagarivorans algicola]|uniref:outer membrane lipoprotein-sorting protein n=1 Tax=Marinagarivorans algicola TaxID=1513270 RepID=UPI0006B5C00E|nr:outer membrane lipoprotein-sorting protein [Marinagarivorans algicola]
MLLKYSAFLTATLLCLASSLSFAGAQVVSDSANKDSKGFTIAKEVQDRDSGWGDSHAKMEMILSNKQGQSSRRTMELKTLEVAGDGDKSLTVFHTPRDVQGTAFLSYSHALEADEQWLYLPALKRVKRISSANKSGPFLGSEFSFEDLSSFEVEKYTYEFIREDTLAGNRVFVVQYTPKYSHSGYTHLEVWIDQKEYLFRKIEFYDRKASHLKTLEFNEYKAFGKYWRAMEYKVSNHQTGKSTILNWQDYAFKTGLNDADFNKNALKRAR